ncbi:phosphotransferase [Streptomyces axinellae]|uniref:phosphotransferase n=1 Tax=Streptomyces axinellae TaxID=552788 RepID=UPI0031DBED28
MSYAPREHGGPGRDASPRAWVRADFSLLLTATERVGLGADTAAEVWHAVDEDGLRYAVKWSGGGSRAALLVPALLAARGVSGIPAPLSTLSGALWSEREGRRLSVVPWVSDEGALDSGLTEDQWRTYGTLLARTHATVPDPETRSALPREDHTHAAETAQVRAFQRALARAAPGSAHGSGSDSGLESAAAATASAASDTAEALLAGADELCRRLRARDPAPAVLCHGDPHLGNVLLREGRPWLIDWDGAALAPPERDLLFVLGGVLASAPVRVHEQAWFFEAYTAAGGNLAHRPRASGLLPLPPSPGKPGGARR